MLFNKKKKKKNINCNCRRISFHSREAVWVCINTPLNIAYLNKSAHCDIEVTMKSYILKLEKFSIPAALLYIALYRKQRTQNMNSYSREICFIHKNVPVLTFFVFRSV